MRSGIIIALLLFIILPCYTQVQQADASRRIEYVIPLGDAMAKKDFSSVIAIADSMLIWMGNLHDEKHYMDSDEVLELLLLVHIKGLAYMGIAEQQKEEFVKSNAIDSLSNPKVFYSQFNLELNRFLNNKTLEASNQLLDTANDNAGSSPKYYYELDSSENSYFNAQYASAIVLPYCSSFKTITRLFQSMGLPKTRDINKEIDIINVCALWARYSFKKSMKGYYHISDPGQIEGYSLIEAKSLYGPVKDRYSEMTENTPLIEGLLNICQFNFSDECITETMELIEKELTSFSGDDFLFMCNHIYKEPGIPNHKGKRVYTAIMAGKKGLAEGSVTASHFLSNGYGCQVDSVEAVRQLKLAVENIRDSEPRYSTYLARYHFFINEKEKAFEILKKIKEYPEFARFGGALLYGQLLEEKGTDDDITEAITCYMDASEYSFFDFDADSAYVAYKRLENIRQTEQIMTEIEDKSFRSLNLTELKDLMAEFKRIGNDELFYQCAYAGSEKKDAYCINQTGLYYLKKSEPDLLESTKYFRDAAALEYAPAIFNYAAALFTGEGDFPNIDMANEYVERFCELEKNGFDNFFSYEYRVLTLVNNTELNGTSGKTLHNYADCFAMGPILEAYGRRENEIHRKLYYLQRAAAKGYKAAITEMGMIYYKATNGVEQDYTKARTYFEEALPDNYACYQLGEIYENGYGVEVDYHKAIDYYSKVTGFHGRFAFDRIKELKDKINE